MVTKPTSGGKKAKATKPSKGALHGASTGALTGTWGWLAFQRGSSFLYDLGVRLIPKTKQQLWKWMGVRSVLLGERQLF